MFSMPKAFPLEFRQDVGAGDAGFDLHESSVKDALCATRGRLWSPAAVSPTLDPEQQTRDFRLRDKARRQGVVTPSVGP
jgi:hypothetical protein